MENFNVLDGKQIDCVQSIFYRGGLLAGFTIRFTNGSLLKVDADSDNSGIEVKVC